MSIKIPTRTKITEATGIGARLIRRVYDSSSPDLVMDGNVFAEYTVELNPREIGGGELTLRHLTKLWAMSDANEILIVTCGPDRALAIRVIL